MFNQNRRQAGKDSSSSGNKRQRNNANEMQSFFGFPNLGEMGMGSGLVLKLFKISQNL